MGGQCRALDADETFGCYYGDCMTTPFLRPFFVWSKFFSLILICLLFLIIKVTASYCIASLIFELQTYMQNTCIYSTVAEYSLPDSLELNAFILTVVCLINHHIVFGLKTLSQRAATFMKRNSASYPF